ncbi:pentapeptide repeat-containing protein [Ensifer sp. PDNC004]|uniref:glyoxalase superfamily protein n=1 Tax=unclassified Ensifer TaxID=2633371 RepID=UPI00177F4872|nr:MULTISPECIES: glyoxalase superfamily protein [unclassified Ensifer]MBD9647727.1 pentapeptide repeat-containing protein [Ensifer sp. ENS09]QRY68437.1 pentapeptide repeat-containing protein [Ensifer sp. PDNC004]
MLRTAGIKSMAKALRQALSDRKMDLSHSDCLELIAKQFGVKDWNALSAAVGQDAGDKPLLFSAEGNEIKLHRTTQRLDVNDTDLAGSRFNDANLSATSFNQINFSGAKFNDSNMTGWYVNDVNLSGAQFQNINLSGAAFSNCRIAGVTLDGVPLEEIVEAYRKSQVI